MADKRRYVTFYRDQFEDVLMGYADTTHWQVRRRGRDQSGEFEYRFSFPSSPFLMDIYSSIDKQTGEARAKNDDSIRIVVKTNPENRWIETPGAEPATSRYTVARTRSWRKNLVRQLQSITRTLRAMNSPDCSRCGDPMVIRKNSDDKDFNLFWGCQNFPECRGLEPFFIEEAS